MGFKNSYGIIHKHYGNDFSLSRNPYGVSEKAKQAFIDAADVIAMYPTSEGELIECISKKEDIHTSAITITAGSVQGLDFLADVLIEKGDEIIVPELTFEEFVYSTDRKKPTLIRSKMMEDGNIDLEDVKSKITDKTKLVYIVNPNNPTGCALPTEKICELALLLKNGYLIVDEANIEFAQDIDSALGYFKMYKNLIVTRTLSKAYGLAGLRLGYLVTPREITDKILDNYPPYKCAEAGYRAAIAALSDDDFINDSVEKIRTEYQRLAEIFDKINIKYIPSSAHTILIKKPEKFDTLDAFIAHLNDNDIGVVKVEKYDAIRIVIKTPDENEVLIKALDIS